MTSKLIFKMETMFWESNRYSAGDHRRMQAALGAVVDHLIEEGHLDAALRLQEEANQPSWKTDTKTVPRL
jgi:outer membrane scaffolding protein for murein synthesis (MipA/OmpV family)